ncbi:MAG: hypothetical protein NVSMB14_01620 [Isosphaeraceae bacterium]
MESNSEAERTTPPASSAISLDPKDSPNFLAGLSRELSRPLLALREEIAGFTESIPRKEETARQLFFSCDRLLDLTRDYFEYARLSSPEAPPPVFQSVYVSTWLTTLDRRFAPTAPERGLSWVLERNGEDFVVSTDGDRLVRVVEPLVGNALKFSLPGGTIRATIGRENEDFWQIDVKDDGPGIPAEELDNLFLPFFRFNPPGFEGEDGNGLGLSLARLLVETLHGEIRIDSTFGKGTRAIVRLPINPTSSVLYLP